MRRLVVALVLALACSPQTIEPSPAPVVPSASAPPACAPALQPLQTSPATLTLLPHVIGSEVLFGFDGAYVGTAGSFPLGAQRHWTELDASGARVGDVETPLYAGVQESPDGRQFIFRSFQPSTPDGFTIWVRDTAGGPERGLLKGEAIVEGWLDADRVLFQRPSDPGTRYVIDTHSLMESVVFRPPAPPTPLAASEQSHAELSGDLRWAVLSRFVGDSTVVRVDLYDVAQQTYVPAQLPRVPSWLSPRGDLLVWIEGTELRAMHLCDGHAVTLASLPQTTSALSGVRWSPDGRYLTLTYGPAYEDTSPERIVLVDLARGTIADIPGVWGFIRRWSPTDDVVVLTRGGYHSTIDRLARLATQ